MNNFSPKAIHALFFFSQGPHLSRHHKSLLPHILGYTHDPQLQPPSNHYPTRKLFQNGLPKTSPSHFHFPKKKTDWDSYTREAEESFVLLGFPSSCSTSEPLFHKILNISAKHHIPQGHILNISHPYLTEIAKPIIIERDALS